MKKILKLFKMKHPLFEILLHFGFYKKMDDIKYIKKYFYCKMGYKINLDNPVTFNEKLNYLKLFDKNPLYTKLVDKVLVKDYIKATIGDEYNVKLINTYTSSKQINFDELPKEFVLKCNHNSGYGLCICKNKNEIDFKKVRKVLNKALKENYFYYGREYPYKNVKPQILAEELLKDEPSTSLKDYKFFCFNGYVDSVMVCVGRDTGHTKFYFFDKDWKLKKYNKISQTLPDDFTIEKPSKINEMFELAGKLSKGMPFVRIDLYCVNSNIYFGEFTFYPSSGTDKNLLPWADKYLGSKIDLSLVYNK